MKIKKLKILYFKVLPSILISTGIVILLITFGPILLSELWYSLKVSGNKQIILSDNLSLDNQAGGGQGSVFGALLSATPTIISPVNKDFSIIVEKIGINAPVVANVSVTDPKKYNEALKEGIAHALTSDYPSTKPGNVYLFAHASLNFWDMGKYSTVFNLLRKLENKDKIHLFYNEKHFIYEVVGKEVYKGWNTYPISRPVIEPILTLQTCDPPGTTLNRMVITARLINYNDPELAE